MAPLPARSRGEGLVVLCIVMMILSISAVILRIWARLTSRKQRFWYDDWCIIASLPLVLATLSTILALVFAGVNHYDSQTSLEEPSIMLKYSYAIEIIYQPAVTMPKYSALFFYVRLFEIKWKPGLFRINILAAAGLVTVSFLIALPFAIFQCAPVRKNWFPLTPGHCVNTSAWFLAIATISVIIDIYIMLLPLPTLWSLHVGRKRKLVLTGFFICAYCVITCSLGRMVAIVQLNKRLEGSPTWNYVTFVYWTASELAISIVSICLPNMVQLFRRAYEHGTPALFTSREYPTGSAGSTFVQGGKGGFQRIVVNDGTTFAIHNDPLDQRIDQSILYSVTVSAQRPGETETAALGQVHMRQDFVVREDER